VKQVEILSNTTKRFLRRRGWF